MTAWAREVALEAKSRTFSPVPSGTDAFTIRLPALRTGLLSDVPAGPALGPQKPPGLLKLKPSLVTRCFFRDPST